jgi:transposase
MGRHEVTDAQWQRLEPLLPPQKPRTGRPNDDHRRILNGILWVLRTGAPWRDLPARYGPVGTVSSRFYRWRQAGIWRRVLEALQAEADAEGRIDWDLHFVDTSIIRAHQHAAGARRTGGPGIRNEALGRSRGGFSTKIHVRAEGYGKPVTFELTGGERHDSTQLEALLDKGAVRRKRGRPRLRPRRVAGDKAFAGRPSRDQLRRRRIGAVIPTTKQQKPPSSRSGAQTSTGRLIGRATGWSGCSTA